MTSRSHSNGEQQRSYPGTVFVVNSGSSSVKFQIVDPHRSGDDAALAHGLVENIGEEGPGRVTLDVFRTDEPGEPDHQSYSREGHIANHRDGFTMALDLLRHAGVDFSEYQVCAVGHRVVHGGPNFTEPVVVTPEIIEEIQRVVPLAPLHNPAHITGIEVAQELLPDVPHVAVFDTAYFHDLPAQARTYAIDLDLAEEHGIRRYGFHGTSHQYVAGMAARALGRRVEDLNQIVCHLGNGASVSAIRGGKPVETSMGLTPLEGLVMGTRSGDIDPGLVLHFLRVLGWDYQQVDDLLNRRSGMKGMCGENDFRRIRELVDGGDETARLAYSVYVHRLRKYIGAYMAVLGKVDVVTFTGGIGENAPYIRKDVLKGLEFYGMKINPRRNSMRGKHARVVSDAAAHTTVMVVPTNEELAIARLAADFAEG